MPSAVASDTFHSRKCGHSRNTQFLREMDEPLHRLFAFDTSIQLRDEAHLIAVHGDLLKTNFEQTEQCPLRKASSRRCRSHELRPLKAPTHCALPVVPSRLPLKKLKMW